MIESLRNIADLVEADEELTLELALMRLGGDPSYICGLENVPKHLLHYFAILCAENAIHTCDNEEEYIVLARAIHMKWSWLKGDVSNEEMQNVNEELRLHVRESYDMYSWIAYYLTPPRDVVMLAMIDTLLHTCCQCPFSTGLVRESLEREPIGNSRLTYTASAMYGLYTERMLENEKRITSLQRQLKEKYYPHNPLKERELEKNPDFVDLYQKRRADHIEIFANVLREYCDLLERVVGMLNIRGGKIRTAHKLWGTETEEVLFEPDERSV